VIPKQLVINPSLSCTSWMTDFQESES
jgi:hypothetical protein